MAGFWWIKSLSPATEDSGRILTRKHRPEWRILGATLVLMVIGLIVIYAIGPQRVNFLNAYGYDYAENYFFVRQLIAVGLALAVLALAYKMPYEWLRRLAGGLMIVGLALSVYLAVGAWLGGPLVVCQSGGCRWLGVSSLSFQPAELLKLGLILYVAQLATKWKKIGKLEKKEFLGPLALVGLAALALVVVAQKDLGTGVVLVGIGLLMLWESGLKLRVLALIVALLVGGGVATVLVAPHRIERVATWVATVLGQDVDDDDSYHLENALMALGVGGLTGVGIGNSVQATGYLPESINDSVFAVMGETFGLVGLMVVIGLFVWLLMRILRVAERLDFERRLVAVGVFAWILTQMVINIAAMTGIFPLTGIPLPLLSYGGTSMVVLAFGIGLVLQLSRSTSREIVPETVVISDSIGKFVSRRRGRK